MNTDIPYNSYDNSDSDIKELIKSYECLRKGEPNNFLDEEDFEHLCNYFENKGNNAKAKEIISMGITVHKFSSDLRLKKADLLLSLNDDIEAERLIDEAFVFDSTNEDYIILKAEVLIRKEKTAESANLIHDYLLNKKLSTLKDFLEDVINLFLDYSIFDLAIEYSFKLLYIQPNNAWVLRNLRVVLNLANANQEALDFYEPIIKTHPFNSELWINIGFAYQSIGLYEKAIDAYLYALALENKNEEVLYLIIECYLYLKNYAQTIVHLKQLIMITPQKKGEYILILAQCYEKIKNYQLALHSYKIALRDNPKQNALINYHIGNVFFKIKGYETAICFLKKVRTRKFHFKALHLLGCIYLKQNATTNAMQSFKDASLLNPTHKNNWQQFLNTILIAKQYEEGVRLSYEALLRTNHKIFGFYAVGFLLLIGNEAEAKKLFMEIRNGNEKHIAIVKKKFKNLFEQYQWVIPPVSL